jgi:hypothetical protein
MPNPEQDPQTTTPTAQPAVDIDMVQARKLDCLAETAAEQALIMQHHSYRERYLYSK